MLSLLFIYPISLGWWFSCLSVSPNRALPAVIWVYNWKTMKQSVPASARKLLDSRWLKVGIGVACWLAPDSIWPDVLGTGLGFWPARTLYHG